MLTMKAIPWQVFMWLLVIFSVSCSAIGVSFHFAHINPSIWHYPVRRPYVSQETTVWLFVFSVPFISLGTQMFPVCHITFCHLLHIANMVDNTKFLIYTGTQRIRKVMIQENTYLNWAMCEWWTCCQTRSIKKCYLLLRFKVTCLLTGR